jgi:uncharacterized protein
VAAEAFPLKGQALGLAAMVLAFFALMALGGLRGCDEKADDDPDYQRVRLDGRTFRLEIADTYDKRVKGLSERTEIPETGGMLFVFPRDQVRVQGFVMRDCPIPIDIIFLDPSGRIVAMHEMKPEAPRGPDEGKPGEPNQKYEDRLKRYSSRYPAQFAIEIKGGTLPRLKLKEGDKVDLPLESLKARAR